MSLRLKDTQSLDSSCNCASRSSDAGERALWSNPAESEHSAEQLHVECCVSGPSHGQGIIEKHGGGLASAFVRGRKAKLGQDPDSSARDFEEERIRMSPGEDHDDRSNPQALPAASAADCNGHNRQHFIVEWLRFDKSRTKEDIAKPETEESGTATGAPSPPIISAKHDPPVLPPRPPPQYVQPQAWGVWCLLAGLFGGRGLQ